jgi:pimeloyl-ACP methyl ester carboxylesterase
MQTHRIPASSGVARAGCIVLLPGALQELADFARAGFDAAVHERGLPWDLVLAAPQLAHLTDRSWLIRLHEEVMGPARERGQTLWLGGISLGAFMALRFAAGHRRAIDGLCLLAPYLGSRIVAAEIAGCDSLQSWQPGVPADEDDERQIWCYVRGLRPPPPRLFLGFGASDRFADTQRVLARALPPACSLQIDGGHEWPVWRQLWDNFLDHHLQP